MSLWELALTNEGGQLSIAIFKEHNVNPYALRRKVREIWTNNRTQAGRHDLFFNPPMTDWELFDKATLERAEMLRGGTLVPQILPLPGPAPAPLDVLVVVYRLSIGVLPPMRDFAGLQYCGGVDGL